MREAGKYVFPGQIVARDGYAEAVAERVPVWSLKRRSAQEAGREIRAVLAKIAERLDQETTMTLDLSFKELVDAAANPNAATGRPLLVAIDCIDEDPDQPRRNFSEQELEELSQSIGEHGVLQPIMLRRSSEDGRYVIVMGARRYRAAQRAGLREMPAFVQDGRCAGSIRADDREYPAR